MPKVIKANTQAIGGAAGDFATAAQNLEEQIKNVTNSINNLASEWSGTGADSFNNVMVRWNKDVQEVQNCLTEVAQHVKQAGVSYDDLEAAISKGFTPQ